MGVCNKITIGAAVEVGLGLYYAAKVDAWKLGSTTNSVYAVASAASAGGLLLCLALMLWRAFQGRPLTHALATPVMLLAEGLHSDDQRLLDSAAILLPIQSVAIAVLWLTVSAVGATAVDFVVLVIVLYYCLALVYRASKLTGDRSFNSDVEHLQLWCLLPLSLLLLETVLASSQDWKGGLGLLAVDGYFMFLTITWLKGFALELILAPPLAAIHTVGIGECSMIVFFTATLAIMWFILKDVEATGSPENTYGPLIPVLMLAM